MITIKNLTKSYASNVVLEEVNLNFEGSKILGIVGKNGAGKSTLFKCITGLENYEGDIIFQNKEDIKKIGYLPTHPYIMSKITGGEYLQLLCNARNLEYHNSDQNNIFNLPLQEYAQNYSTGMLKKLALTGILLQKNEIFIFDEPYNGLDLESNLLVNTIVKKLRSHHKLVIISSHMLSGLYEICDQINFIHNKQVTQINNKEDFKTLENHINTKDFEARIDSLQL